MYEDVDAANELVATTVGAEREAVLSGVAPLQRRSSVVTRIMAQTSATKRKTLYRMLEGSTLETALIESRRKSDDHFTVVDLNVQQLPARLVYGAIATRTKWANDVMLLTGRAISLSNSSPELHF